MVFRIEADSKMKLKIVNRLVSNNAVGWLALHKRDCANLLVQLQLTPETANAFHFIIPDFLPDSFLDALDHHWSQTPHIFYPADPDQLFFTTISFDVTSIMLLVSILQRTWELSEKILRELEDVDRLLLWEGVAGETEFFHACFNMATFEIHFNGNAKKALQMLRNSVHDILTAAQEQKGGAEVVNADAEGVDALVGEGSGGW